MGDGATGWAARVVAVGIASAVLVVGQAGGQLPLGGPNLVNSATPAGDQQGPSVGMADDGRLRVFWSEATTLDVLQRAYAANGSPFNASAPNQVEAAEFDAAASVNGSGDWIVSWSSNQVQDGGLDLFARRSSNNGTTLPSEFQATVAAAVDVDRAARLSRADDDSYVAVWVDDLAPGDLQFRKFAADGAPVTGDLSAGEATDPDLDEFDVASAPDGSFLIAWQGDATPNEQVFARCFDDSGDPLGPQFIVPAELASRNLLPRVAVDALGFYVVAWIEGGTTDIEWRRFAPDCEPVGGDRLAVAGGSEGNQNFELDMARDGAMVLAWNSEELDPDQGISVLELTKSGKVVGAEFLAHEAAAGRQILPDAAIGDLLFAVVWEDQEDSPSIQDDILLRRFVRRVVFTDDFESADDAYWSSSTP